MTRESLERLILAIILGALGAIAHDGNQATEMGIVGGRRASYERESDLLRAVDSINDRLERCLVARDMDGGR